MLRSLFFVVALCASPFATSEELLSDVPYGVAHLNAEAWKSLEGCDNNDMRILFSGMKLALAGVVYCPKSRYTADVYLVGSYGGKTFYISPNKVSLVGAELKDLPIYGSDEASAVLMKKAYEQGLVFRQEDEKEWQAKKDAQESYGVSIYDSEPYVSGKYYDRTSWKASVENPTKKTISRVSFELLAYVNMPFRIIPGRNGEKIVTLTKNVKITPGQTKNLDFRDVWLSSDVDFVTTRKIEVHYADGSRKIVDDTSLVYFSENLLRKMRWTDDMTSLLFSEPS